MLPVLYLGSDLQLNKSDKDHVFIGHKKVLSRLFKQSEHQSKQKAASNRCLFVSGTELSILGKRKIRLWRGMRGKGGINWFFLEPCCRCF